MITKEKSKDTTINLKEIVGKGYDDFWKFRGRYRVVKGGRGSKKSCTTSLYYISSMMRYFHKFGLKPNLLVIRRYFNTHLNSTFSQLKWAIKKLKVDHLWKVSKSPLQITYIPSGQVILFRGLDEPDSITSITVDEGELCWVWIEEAFQCANEEAFNKLDMSIRGQVPEPLFKQITLTFNPWSENIWIKPRFFDVKDDPNILALTKNYDCNEFLGEDDIAIFEDMKIKNPRRYRIEGLGDWGIAQGLIYNNVRVEDFDWKNLAKTKNKYGIPQYKEYYGLDFGYSNDPTAFIACLVNKKEKTIHIFDELYMYQATNSQIKQQIFQKGYRKCLITADSEDPRTINELKLLGVRMEPAIKGQNSILHGIQKIQDFQIIVHPSCTNTIIEFSNYVWDVDKVTGKTINKPIDDFNHCLVAGTQVETIDGTKCIEDITTEDYVLTRQGYKKVKWSGVSDVNRQVFKVVTDQGNFIIGTENHGVLTLDGFRRIDTLRYGDKVLIRRNKCLNPNVLKCMEKYGEDTQTPKDEQTGNTLNVVPKNCTTMCGNYITDQERKGMLFITSMETVKTIISKIWKKLLTKCIMGLDTNLTNNNYKNKWNIWKMLDRWQHNGTKVNKEENGIDNMPQNIIGECSTYQKYNVNNVENGLNQKHTIPNSVQKNVVPNTDGIMDLMTLLQLVNGVEKNSNIINMIKDDFVVGRVLQVTSMPQKEDKVYDLTIEDCPEFFANGILVHNCMDALRYALHRVNNQGFSW